MRLVDSHAPSAAAVGEQLSVPRCERAQAQVRKVSTNGPTLFLIGAPVGPPIARWGLRISQAQKDARGWMSDKKLILGNSQSHRVGGRERTALSAGAVAREAARVLRPAPQPACGRRPRAWRRCAPRLPSP